MVPLLPLLLNRARKPAFLGTQGAPEGTWLTAFLFAMHGFKPMQPAIQMTAIVQINLGKAPVGSA
jgi:hypothetical protein